jgi:hypothetical protein
MDVDFPVSMFIGFFCVLAVAAPFGIVSFLHFLLQNRDAMTMVIMAMAVSMRMFVQGEAEAKKERA